MEGLIEYRVVCEAHTDDPRHPDWRGFHHTHAIRRGTRDEAEQECELLNGQRVVQAYGECRPYRVEARAVSPWAHPDRVESTLEAVDAGLGMGRN